MENLTSKQKTILIIVGIIVVGLFVFYMSSRMNSYGEVNLNDMIDNELKEEKINGRIKIHITGAIKNQGVVELEKGARIQDAIEEAGGLIELADISDVNLAYELKDGQKIYIPQITDDQIEEIINLGSGEKVIIDDVVDNSKNTGEKININIATTAELQTLSGIGVGTAEKIIEYRKNNGKFNSIEEIKNVSGIGEAKYQSIKDYIKIE